MLGVLRSPSRASRRGPIGLELSHEKLHMLQMESGGDGVRIRAACSTSYPVDRDSLLGSRPQLRAFIAKELANRPFSGRQVVTCMPAADVKLALIHYQAPDGGDEAPVILQRVLERVGGAPEDWVVDYVPVSTRDSGQGDKAALTACARHEEVVDYLELLRSAKLDVQALEIGPLSIQRLVTSISNTGTEENVLTLNFGSQKTFLTVFTGRRLALEREVFFGESEVIKKVARSLDMSETEARELLYRYGVSPAWTQSAQGDAEAASPDIAETIGAIVKPRFLELAEEIEKVVIYTASQMRGAAVDCVYLLGSVARWPGAEALLNDLLSLPVEVLNPFSAFMPRTEKTPVKDLDPIAGIAIATGCALRGLEE